MIWSILGCSPTSQRLDHQGSHFHKEAHDERGSEKENSGGTAGGMGEVRRR